MHRSLIIVRWLLIVVLFASCSQTNQTLKPGVITHPDGELYVGDQVSFEVLAPASMDLTRSQVQVSIHDHVLGSAIFGPYGVGARLEAVLWWIWDTRGLKPGLEKLTFTVLPDGPTWEETITLNQEDQVPQPEQDSHWASTTSTCCIIFYITGTDAARDINAIRQTADVQAADVESKLHTSFNYPVTVTFLPRTLGNGGFSEDSIYVSYLDQNYAGSTTSQVLHHEMTHMLDAQLGGGYRPTIFVEGLAVYVSGGHFKLEPLLQRAATLSGLGWYIPLELLANDFYPQQHEIGYLEAGALIAYLVQSYGWSAFNDFYRHIPDPAGSKPSRVIDQALETHFGLSFAQLNTDFIAFLKTQTVTDNESTDLRLTVKFYDTVRRYQKGLDSSAYFMTA